MSVDLSLITIFWLLELTRKVPSLVFWWQIKEYRWDRFRTHLGTDQGRRLLFGPVAKAKYLLFFLGIMAAIDLSWPEMGIVNFIVAGFLFFSALLPLLTLGFYLVLSIRVLPRLKGWTKLPIWTLKARLIVISFFIIELGLCWRFWTLREGRFFMPALLIGDISILPLSFLLVAIFNFPTKIWQRQRYRQALIKLAKYPNLIKIAITGSYGKTSTKTYLKDLLSQKYQVLATPGSVNTPIGLAQMINKQLANQTQVVVAEMGAYQIGEISQMCQLIKPKIGILTAINPQHQALFKSMTAVEQAKFELIKSLPDDGLAIFNADDERVSRLSRQTKTPSKFYSTQREVDFWAKKIKVKRNSVEFYLKTKGTAGKIEAPLLGRHNVSNLLAAIAVADYLGMSFEEIKQAAKKLTPPAKTLKPSGVYQGAFLIDDTWNANPDGVMAALNYLDEAWPKSRKIIILQPMIELGEFGGEEHQRVGEKLAGNGAVVFLTNDNYYLDLQLGFNRSSQKIGLVNVYQDDEKIVVWLQTNLRRGDVVLFEGKEAEKVLTSLGTLG